MWLRATQHLASMLLCSSCLTLLLGRRRHCPAAACQGRPLSAEQWRLVARLMRLVDPWCCPSMVGGGFDSNSINFPKLELMRDHLAQIIQTKIGAECASPSMFSDFNLLPGRSVYRKFDTSFDSVTHLGVFSAAALMARRILTFQCSRLIRTGLCVII